MSESCLMLANDKLYVGGQWVSPATGGVLEVRSPHDRALNGGRSARRPR
jgi:aldehyde dehydrogenase (NAD+)